MLDGIAVSQPQPKIPPELIKFLGKTYNAWHIAIPLLESHVVMFPSDLRCFDSLVELYKLVRARLVSAVQAQGAEMLSHACTRSAPHMRHTPPHLPHLRTAPAHAAPPTYSHPTPPCRSARRTSCAGCGASGATPRSRAPRCRWCSRGTLSWRRTCWARRRGPCRPTRWAARTVV